MVRPMPTSDPAPIGLRPATDLAERVLLPGDPHRALAVAQALLTAPRMFNHNRGLWGYTGEAPDGAPLTVQATGMGGPSAAIVVEELISLGARSLIRIGTCGAFAGGLAIGDLVAAVAVVPDDGTSRALGSPALLRPDSALTEALLVAGGHERPEPATVVTTDLFYDDRPAMIESWIEAGAAVVEMEAATVLQVAARRGVAAACLLAVTDLLEGGVQTAARERIAPAALEDVGVRLGRVGHEALAALGGDSGEPIRTR